jgi:putative ABC transport system ATP-binding protein
MSAILQIIDLRKTYRSDGVKAEVLRGINLSVARGSFVAVMGPSGCGKSTLLHILGGLDRPTSGEVLVCGQRITELNETARAVLRRKTVGFVFQAYNLVPNLSIAENVELPALLIGESRRRSAARRQELLEALGLPDKAGAMPGELSGGEQQRVAIARALVNHPDILLLDEPTGNLDSRSGGRVMDLVRRFHGNGQTILLVTHDARVASNAQSVSFMRDGQLVDETLLATPGNPSAVLARLVQLEL